MNLRGMFDDQRAFNQQIWVPPSDWVPIAGIDDPVETARLMDRIRHLALGMVEETLEFLRTYEWKSHRRHKGKLQNVAHSHEELVDMFKYWLSLADLADFPIDNLEDLYYAKSRVVQYRYQEEWLKEIEGPCVLVDIDNVLADYITGLCKWAREWGPQILSLSISDTTRFCGRLDSLQRMGSTINHESVGVTYAQWQTVKHKFRTSGGKRTLPVFKEARPFLNWCRERGWMIILVTSRPIDRYPNIFTDTVTWLHDNQLPFDYLWWADNKALRMEEFEHASLQAQTVFAVDDDHRFIAQYRSKGVKAYWLNRFAEDSQMSNDPTTVRSLTSLMEKEMTI